MHLRAFVVVAAVLLSASGIASAQPSPADVEGTIRVSSAGGPTIVTAQGTLTITNAAWKDYLVARDGQPIEARVRRGSSDGLAALEAVYRRMKAKVQLQASGDPLLAEDRSNQFTVHDEPWRGLLKGLGDAQVEARVEITKAGPFGGEAKVLRLRCDLTGTVTSGSDGVRLEDDSRRFRIVDDAAWSAWLASRVDDAITLRVDVVGATKNGGTVKVVSAALDELEGQAQDSGAIAINRSTNLQVVNQPFRDLVAAASGRRVTAVLRLVKPGPFGGEVEADSILTRAEQSLQLLERPEAGAPTVARLRAGRELRIVGDSGSYLQLELEDGTVGYAPRGSLSAGRTRGIARSLPTR